MTGTTPPAPLARAEVAASTQRLTIAAGAVASYETYLHSSSQALTTAVDELRTATERLLEAQHRLRGEIELPMLYAPAVCAQLEKVAAGMREKQAEMHQIRQSIHAEIAMLAGKVEA